MYSRVPMVRLLTLRVVPLVGSLLLPPVTAQAETFTGFYAGVNAGYGWGHEESKGMAKAPASAALPLAADTSGDGLPPSASAAASALRRSGTGRAAPGR